jgi:hypothetical protein
MNTTTHSVLCWGRCTPHMYRNIHVQSTHTCMDFVATARTTCGLNERAASIVYETADLNLPSTDDSGGSLELIPRYPALSKHSGHTSRTGVLEPSVSPRKHTLRSQSHVDSCNVRLHEEKRNSSTWEARRPHRPTRTMERAYEQTAYDRCARSISVLLDAFNFNLNFQKSVLLNSSSTSIDSHSLLSLAYASCSSHNIFT